MGCGRGTWLINLQASILRHTGRGDLALRFDLPLGGRDAAFLPLSEKEELMGEGAKRRS